MRTTIRHVTVLAAATLVLTALAVPAQGAGGGKDKCRVKNMTTRVASEDLQAQIDAAEPGDTLKIKGRCVGNFAILAGKALTLLGIEKAGVQATLDGDGSGPVLYIQKYADVTLTDLIITGGIIGGVGMEGAGIYNAGTLTLNGSSWVIGNIATNYADGGGIVNWGGVLLRDFAMVIGNEADGAGGGILNWGSVLLMDSAEVSWNEAGTSGGGIKNAYSLKPGSEGGSVTLIGSSKVMWNTADSGGGISNADECNVALSGSSQVSDNTAKRDGGGIWSFWGGASMEGQSTVTGNIADSNDDGMGRGGGIYGCVEGAVDGGNVDDNYRRTDALQVEDNIYFGCP